MLSPTPCLYTQCGNKHLCTYILLHLCQCTLDKFLHVALLGHRACRCYFEIPEVSFGLWRRVRVSP